VAALVTLDLKALREGARTVSAGREFHSLMVRGKKHHLGVSVDVLVVTASFCVGITFTTNDGSLKLKDLKNYCSDAGALGSGTWPSG
jgi:hypothetical protein